MKYLSECDLIIYDLHSGNPQDVMLALEALRKFKFEEEKVLILISSLMAWSGTPRKLEELKTPEQLAEEARLAELAAKADAEGAEEDKPKEDDEEPPEEDNEDAEDKSKKDEQPQVDKPKVRKRYKHLPFSEKDYGLRDPIEEYKIIKEVEDEVLNFKKENVKTYVISAGILYGKGEAIFNSHIQKAWLQDPPRLPYVGDGNNRLPTIHVTDLARMVKKIYESKPERKYIFAIDNNKKPTQKKLITAISNGIGTGLVESIDIPDAFKMAHPKMTPIQLDLDWKKSLLLDLFVTPSSLFIKNEAEGGGGEEGGEDGGGEVLELNWHCKAGLAENIQLVKDEFAKERKLKPIKIFITGPPCSGKSFFGKQLADHYNVPHISIGTLLDEIQVWD
jgi:adenylate kinase